MSARCFVYVADCLDVLPSLKEASVDAVVTDPPYGLEFMQKKWDSFRAGEVGDWRHGFSPTGYGDADRMQRPAFGSSRNPVCQECHKHQRGRDRCQCGSPAFEERPADSNSIYQAWCEAWARECLRVLKPGGHLLAFGAPRTYHRLACAIEDAGFEVRDSIHWITGTGFPKALDVSKAIDKELGAEREVTAEGNPVRRMIPGADQNKTGSWIKNNGRFYVPTETKAATEEAARWEGWATALKPAHEAVIVARKPLAGTVASTVMAYGTGALHVDACRVETADNLNGGAYSGELRQRDVYSASDAAPGAVALSRLNRGVGEYAQPPGRWPPNLILTHAPDCEPGACVPGCPAAEMDRQSGPSGEKPRVLRRHGARQQEGWGLDAESAGIVHGGSGGASRFFPQPGWDEADFPFIYQAKASQGERPKIWGPGCACEGAEPSTGMWEKGAVCAACGEKAKAAQHATVKPLALLRWLVRLVTPPGGVVLDPFAGTGTTGQAALLEGMKAALIERDAGYAQLIRKRLEEHDRDGAVGWWEPQT